MPSSHFVYETVSKFRGSTPMYYVAIAGLVVYLLQLFFESILEELGFTLQWKEIEVDEDLPNFFHAIKLSHADEIVLEAQNIKDNYGIEIEDPRIIERLDMTVQPKRCIHRTPWY